MASEEAVLAGNCSSEQDASGTAVVACAESAAAIDEQAAAAQQNQLLTAAAATDGSSARDEKHSTETEEALRASVASAPFQQGSSAGAMFPGAADELVERALHDDRSLAALLNADGPVRWPSSEVVLHQVACSLERRYLLHPGTMYISKRYLCFQLTSSGSSSFLEAAGASASSFLSFGYRSSPAANSGSAALAQAERRSVPEADGDAVCSARDCASSVASPRSASGNGTTVSPGSLAQQRASDSGSTTLWLIPFEAVTSVRKSSYLYLESALEVSTTFGLCNHTRHGGVFWTKPQEAVSGIKLLRFAAFSEPNRDVVYQYVMKAWMARLSLLALEGRLPLTMQTPSTQHALDNAGKPATQPGSENNMFIAGVSEVKNEPRTTKTNTAVTGGLALSNAVASQETLKTPDTSANGSVVESLSREDGAAVAVETPYDIDAGQVVLEIPAHITSAQTADKIPEALLFELFFADTATLPKQLNEALGHTELQMSTWQLIEPASDAAVHAASAFPSRHRTISYQVTVRRGILSFTGHCTESQSFRLTPPALRDAGYPYGALYEMSVITRDMPSSDTFLVRQRIFFDMQQIDKVWRVRVRAVLGIQWLGRTVWRPFIERSVAAQSRHAFEQYSKLMDAEISKFRAREGAAQIQHDPHASKPEPIIAVMWVVLASRVRSLVQRTARAVEQALVRLPPPLLARLFLTQTVLLMLCSGLCGYLLGQLSSRSLP
jgi:hypothetical protein